MPCSAWPPPPVEARLLSSAPGGAAGSRVTDGADDGRRASNGEQSTGISQVNAAVSPRDRMLQQNAALAEQGSPAAQSMKGQAAHQAESAGVYGVAR
jgi:methyl-accepting chemotaxis protein